MHDSICRLALVMGLAGLPAQPALAGASIFFVDEDLMTGGNSGGSWEDAFQGQDGLQAALALAGSGDSVWVAAGTYRPSSSGNRAASFNLENGVAILGGFAGGERAEAERDPDRNITNLTGDLNGDDGLGLITDNSFHVANGASAGASAILDGFTISAGNANGPLALDQDRGGGAIFLNASNGSIRQCRFIDNRCTFGGGACYVRSASPGFADCDFQDNFGGSFGGAFDIFNLSNPDFDRCRFIGNTAARAGGVEIFGQCAPQFDGCLWYDNTSTGGGGGGALFIASNSAPTIRNATIAFNHASVQVGGVLTSGSATTINNSIIWANDGPGGSMTAAQQVTHTGALATNITFSDVMGGFAGFGNINADPDFADGGAGDLHIVAGSPCIDAANSSAVPAAVTTDLDGNPRLVDDPATTDSGFGSPPIVDMGAYEFQPAADCPEDFDGSGEIGFADLLQLLAAWGPCPGCEEDLDGSGEVGFADLLQLLAAWGPCD